MIDFRTEFSPHLDLELQARGHFSALTMKSSLPRLLCFIFILAAPAHGANWAKHFPHEHKSRYFVFHHQRPQWDAASFARFADGFVDLVGRDFMDISFDYPIDVLVLPNRDAFQQYLRRELGVDEPPNFGIYFRAFKVFATFEDSGLGTFAHEIMHPLVDRHLRDAPTWAAEAIPSFFEKFFGYWDSDRLMAQWGYQNPWRIQALGEQLTGIDLKRLLADKRPVTNYQNSDRRLLTVFLWQHGKFATFIRLIGARDRAGYKSYFEAAMERPLAEIVPLWNAYLKEIQANRVEILQIPGSQLFESRRAYDHFILLSGVGAPQGG